MDEKRDENIKEGRISIVKKKPNFSYPTTSQDEEQGTLRFSNHENVESYSFEGLSNFTLKSEYLEKDITIDDSLVSSFTKGTRDSDITTIKVFREHGIDEVSAESLKSYIENNKDINKVVIEKISLSEASRISLHFEPDQGKKSFKIVSPSPSPASESLDLSAIEDQINSDFLNDNIEADKPDVSRARLSLGVAQKGIRASSVDKTLSYEKHSLTRKKAKVSAANYYRVKDHMELFKVGSSYLRDYKSGVRSMGFSSYDLQKQSEKTIFGISSFFNYHHELNICIITDDIEHSFYNTMLNAFDSFQDVYTEEDIEYNFYHSDGHDFIEYQELLRVESHSHHFGMEDFIEFLLSKYDLIFWDLPSLKTMNRKRELFFPVVRSLESLTLIVEKEVTKKKDIDSLISYFEKYQVPIKGVLFSDSEVSQKKMKRKEVKDGTA